MSRTPILRKLAKHASLLHSAGDWRMILQLSCSSSASFFHDQGLPDEASVLWKLIDGSRLEDVTVEEKQILATGSSFVTSCLQDS